MRTCKDRDAALEYVLTELPWGAAAGTCRDANLAGEYAQAGMNIVTWGSNTWLSRAGNPGDNFYHDETTGDSINAWGIPNKGIRADMPEILKAHDMVNIHGAQFSVSISAGNTFDPKEYFDMARMLNQEDAADIIEGNFSCGNMEVDGEYKPIVCFDLELFDVGVKALCEGAGSTKKAVKLTPTTERRFLVANIKTCLQYNVDYVIMSNTIPNCYLERDGKPAITMKRGGLGGAALRPIVTGMLQIAAPLVKGTTTKLIAAGGVDRGLHAYNYLKHGAHGFVFNTVLSANNYDPKVAQEIITGRESTLTLGLVDFLANEGLPD